MKRAISYILSMLLAFSSCTYDRELHDAAMPDDFSGIRGFVGDMDGNPIEHISVTITIEGQETLTVYTSDRGTFIAQVDIKPATQIHIKIEDTDGEDYGGLFLAKEDTIQVSEEPAEGPLRISVDYRLTPATA